MILLASHRESKCIAISADEKYILLCIEQECGKRLMNRRERKLRKEWENEKKAGGRSSGKYAPVLPE